MDNTPPLPPSAASQAVNDVTAEAKSLIGAITDFSFSSFFTPRMLRLIYAVLLLAIAYHSVEFMIIAIRIGSVMAFISGLLTLVVGVILTRVFVEVVQAIFKIHDTLKNIEWKQK